MENRTHDSCRVFVHLLMIFEASSQSEYYLVKYKIQIITIVIILSEFLFFVNVCIWCRQYFSVVLVHYLILTAHRFIYFISNM